MGASRGRKSPLMQPPIPQARRGSAVATRSSQLPPVVPSRSRSLDGLLDTKSEPELTCQTHSCEQLVDKEIKDDTEEDSSNEGASENKITASQLSLSTESNKRKRNFMDRCVNKVRSLIRK